MQGNRLINELMMCALGRENMFSSHSEIKLGSFAVDNFILLSVEEYMSILMKNIKQLFGTPVDTERFSWTR